MDWIDAVLGLLGVLSLAAFSFSIRQALSAKQAATRVELELADFKTEIAKDYATNRALDKVQERIMHELEKLNKKLDRLFEQRMEGR